MRGLVLCALIGCGPGIVSADPKKFANETIAGSIGDPKAIAALMHGSVVNGGVWFTDPECTRQFAGPAALGPDKFDAFARCLAALHLEASPRKDSLPDVAVLRYAPGFEIEARVLDTADGPQLTWIGFESRRDSANGLPTIASDAFELLRDGPRDAPIPNVDGQPAEVWLEVCLDAAGTVTGAHPRETTSLHAARMFAAAAQSWKLHPFLVGGVALPVCAMLLEHTPDHTPPHEALPPPTPDSQIQIAPRTLSKARIAGRLQVSPSDRVKVAIEKSKTRRLIGGFEYCVDATGHVSSTTLLRTTGVPSYDQELVKAIHGWVFEPQLDEGKAVPVCGSAKFIYTQN